MEAVLEDASLLKRARVGWLISDGMLQRFWPGPFFYLPHF